MVMIKEYARSASAVPPVTRRERAKELVRTQSLPSCNILSPEKQASEAGNLVLRPAKTPVEASASSSVKALTSNQLEEAKDLLNTAQTSAGTRDSIENEFRPYLSANARKKQRKKKRQQLLSQSLSDSPAEAPSIPSIPDGCIQVGSDHPEQEPSGSVRAT